MPTPQNVARYRLHVASRIFAAAIGGYALSCAVAVLIALVWPADRAQAVQISTVLSFLLYPAIIVWIFAVRRLRTIWLGLVLATVLCSGVDWLLLHANGRSPL